MKSIKVFLIVIFLSVLGFIIYRSLTKETKVVFSTVKPEKRDINETIFIPGNVYPIKEIEVKSQLSGIVENISVKIGDHVQVGTPVASIKLVPGTADIERLENNVNLAQIDYDARSIDYERSKRLYETNTISKVEMNDYERAYMISKENLISSKNQLDILKKGRIVSKNISNIVTSSTTGTIIDIPLEVGSSVIERNNYNAGTTVALVAETDLFKFRTLIAEHYLKDVSLGDSIALTFNAYEDFTTKAVITKISSKGNSENGIMKYPLDAEFAITDQMPTLRSGYSATAEFNLNSRINVLSIEEKFTFYEKDSAYLYVMDSGKEAIKKNVTLGISDGEYTEILDGISVNEKVITNYDKVK